MKTVHRRELLFATIFLLIAWELTALAVNQPILPAPAVVAQAFIVELGRGLVGHFLSSLWRVVASTFLAILLAAPAGIILGQSPRLDSFFSPLLYLLYPIPKVVFVPIILLFFGVGDLPKIAIIFLILFFQILVLVHIR